MNLGPLIATVIAGLVYKEKLTFIDSISCVTAFMGVGILSYASNSQQNEQYPNMLFGIILAVGSGMAAGFTQNMIRQINKIMHPLYSTFYSGCGGGLAVVFGMLIGQPPNILQYKTPEVCIMILQSYSDLFGVICNSLAFRYAEVSKVIPLFYLMIVFCFIYDIFIKGVVFGLLEVCGALVIVISVVTPKILMLMEALRKENTKA
jgi:drug/metabolite transporter (DMT)-like permease